MQFRDRRVARMALMTGPPAAVVALSRDDAPVLRWVNRAMADLLGFDRAGDLRVPLADAVLGSSRGRLVAAAHDLVRARGQSVSVQVVTTEGGAAQPVWFHLLADPPRGIDRLLAAVGVDVRRRAVLHAQPHHSTVVDWADGVGDPRRQIADHLNAALLRLRRHPSRLALTMVWAHRHGPVGPQQLPEGETERLAERLAAAARDTDTVVPLGAGQLGLLAEDASEGGEIALAERVLAVVDGALHGGPPSVVTVAVLEVADPDADPLAVIAHLERAALPVTTQGGLVVLPAWADVPPGDDGARHESSETIESRRRLRRALTSGRFVIGYRSVRPLSTGGLRGGSAPGESAVGQLMVLLEVCTADDGILTPVRLSAPGLAAALDEWALEQLDVLGLPAVPVALRLQSAGTLTTELGDAAVALVARRPGLRLVLQVPEQRLEEAIAAKRKVLDRLAAGRVGLGVSDWSGRLDVPTLVRSCVGLVELSSDRQRDVVRADGAALLAALVGGLSAGLGPRALVVAEHSDEIAVTSRLAACGLVWAASSPALMMIHHDGGPKQTGSGVA